MLCVRFGALDAGRRGVAYAVEHVFGLAYIRFLGMKKGETLEFQRISLASRADGI